MAFQPGSFVWYNLATNDMSGASAFYGTVVGWATQAANTPDMDHAMFTMAQDPVAGCMTLPDHARQAGARPSWRGYVGVADVDATAADIALRHGCDPQGVRFGLVASN